MRGSNALKWNAGAFLVASSRGLILSPAPMGVFPHSVCFRIKIQRQCQLFPGFSHPVLTPPMGCTLECRLWCPGGSRPCVFGTLGALWCPAGSRPCVSCTLGAGLVSLPVSSLKLCFATPGMGSICNSTLVPGFRSELYLWFQLPAGACA